MKVDKGVCTNDDSDTAVMVFDENFHRVQRYGAVFTTLLENKILAIKRETAAATERQKKQGRKKSKSPSNGGRPFGGGSIGKRIFCIKRNSLAETELATVERNENENVCQVSGSVGGDQSSKPDNTFDVEVRDQYDNSMNINSTDAMNKYDAESARIGVAKVVEICGSNGKGKDGSIATYYRPTMTVNHERTSNISSQKCETDSLHSDKSRKITFKGDVLEDSGVQLVGINGVEAPQPVDPSPYSSIFEINVSDDSLRKSRKGSTETTFSFPSSISAKRYSFNTQEACRLLDHERHRLRVLEAKSISAQCSPIFPRSLRSCSTQSDAILDAGTSVLNHPLKVLSRQFTSEDSAGITISSTCDDPEISRFADTIATSSSASDKKRKLNAPIAQTPVQSTSSLVISSYGRSNTNKKNDKVVSHTSYANNDTQGFISSFNQITSNNINNSININLPVITTTTTKLRTAKCDKNNMPTPTMVSARKNRSQHKDRSGGGGKGGNSGGCYDNSSVVSEEESRRIRKKYRKWLLVFTQLLVICIEFVYRPNKVNSRIECS